MKLVGVESGRVSLLVDLIEIGSRKGLYLPDVGVKVQARYSFVHMPQVPEIGKGDGNFRFEQGQLPQDSAQDAKVSLFEIYPQGIVATANDTEEAEAFIEDFMSWGGHEFGLRAPDVKPMKLYASTLVVEFDDDVDQMLTKWSAVGGLLTGLMKRKYGVTEPVHLQRVTFRHDPEKISPRLGNLLVEFNLERRVYVPFERNRFHSTAPLSTNEHVQMLERIESTFHAK